MAKDLSLQQSTERELSLQQSTERELSLQHNAERELSLQHNAERELSLQQRVERSLIKTYRKTLWNPFIAAVKRYELVSPGDRIAVCISGGKDSMVLAKLMQELQRHTDRPFHLEFLAMDPGYRTENRRLLESNAQMLGIPLEIRESGIFHAVEQTEKNPCYLCARMRRGFLYARAQELGCTKIALGHHFSDVIETTLLGLFYGAQLQAMPPKVRSKNFPGMELIRPLYCVHENAVIAWRNYHNLQFLRCACRFTEQRDAAENGIGESKRQEIKQLLKDLKRENPNIEKSIFRAIHGVQLDTFPGFKTRGNAYSFLEFYDREKSLTDEAVRPPET